MKLYFYTECYHVWRLFCTAIAILWCETVSVYTAVIIGLRESCTINVITSYLTKSSCPWRIDPQSVSYTIPLPCVSNVFVCIFAYMASVCIMIIAKSTCFAIHEKTLSYTSKLELLPSLGSIIWWNIHIHEHGYSIQKAHATNLILCK